MSGDWEFPEFRPPTRPLRDYAQMITELEAQGNIRGLLEILEGDYPGVTRRTAARALISTAGKPESSAILALLDKETDRGVKISLVGCLGKCGDVTALPALTKALKDSEPMVRVEAAAALSRFNSETAFKLLLDSLNLKNKSDDYLVRQYSAEALGKMGDRRAVQALIAVLKDENSLVKAAVATALGELGDPAAITALVRAHHSDPHLPGSDCVECSAIDEALRKLNQKQIP
ncbi:HEAT repeat domain-containing protein [Candidatus Chlorohelix sp.]|uniref:HEAT repeat domain-containing protein n=1 Tax=Candidatus Chlorohelix sp. TaxID=3139201 RepID=UPI00305ED3A5